MFFFYVQVGIYTMGARNKSINELLSLKSGISHRAVQESLNGLTIGDDPFDYSSVLRKIEGSFSDQRNVTKVEMSKVRPYRNCVEYFSFIQACLFKKIISLLSLFNTI